jgi:hypothetical protein
MIQPLMVFTFVLSCLAAILGVNIFHVPQVNILIPAYGVFFAARAGTLFLLQNLIWLSLALGIVLCTLAPWISLVSTLKIQNLSLLGNSASLLVLLLLCFGISLSTMRGVGRAMFTNRNWEWTRTPKYDETQKKSGLAAEQVSDAVGPPVVNGVYFCHGRAVGDWGCDWA